ncbi:hypothetical protein M419DRAFT_33876 [Trichoderma reesei RUT C-30]|jgi:DNA-binding Lrp family transcriptional regulator|uniref:Uncharacterized protein n=1 Tax=Hypocrea jecorina (strain ATCC 56765 / BCRC 32924 / NRRL 11460 / Rut C-30) TaxID=1344414 RepID=A0A024SET3_HYPJR|nr:hypothetical protein M419DRAFT_33876 [Trichoderma reesei RUT C-30]
MLPATINQDGSPSSPDPRPSSTPIAQDSPQDNDNNNRTNTNEAQPPTFLPTPQTTTTTTTHHHTDEEEDAALARQAAILVRKLRHDAAELANRPSPASIADLLPVIELHRRVARLVRPPSSAERHKWEQVLDTLGRSRSAHEEIRNLDREDRVDCEKMRDECAYIRRKCIRYCKWYDKVQEQVNALFDDDDGDGDGDDKGEVEEEEEEVTAAELYDFLVGSMGEQEQQLEEILDEVIAVMQGIDDRMAWLEGQEERTMGIIRGLSRMERMVVDILFSFDCWFGEE